jgi:FKBP-type peptidyl-prolyl cis-trans isomerase FkpA
MTSKFKILINTTVAVFILLLVSSCLKTDDDRKTYSAAEEKILREAYLSNLVTKGHDIDTTSTGVYYVIIDDGEGEFAKEGDTLTVGYAGYFIDGVMFDSSEIHFPDGKYEFILGVDPMIDGWEDGVKLMNKGARFQFIIPSEKAYGSKGYGTIPPYQTLVFVIKLYEIQPS